ncbi:MAG: transcriptional regulator [Planctomycetota bacterium]|nr:transcriptional regulator [Planctomycetota bacterium]
MTESDFQQKLSELLGQIDTLPETQQGPLRELAVETRERHNRMRKAVSELQESLDYLRLSVKYLVFDLEATRRENEYLRKLIDSQARRDPESREDDGE